MPYSKMHAVTAVPQRLDQVARLPRLRLVDTHDPVAEVVVHPDDVRVRVVHLVVRALPLLRRVAWSHCHVEEWIFGSRIQSHWPCRTLCPISMLSRISARLSAAVPASQATLLRPASSTIRPPSSSPRCTRISRRMYAASRLPRSSRTSWRMVSSSCPSSSTSAGEGPRPRRRGRGRHSSTVPPRRVGTVIGTITTDYRYPLTGVHSRDRPGCQSRGPRWGHDPEPVRTSDIAAHRPHLPPSPAPPEPSPDGTTAPPTPEPAAPGARGPRGSPPPRSSSSSASAWVASSSAGPPRPTTTVLPSTAASGRASRTTGARADRTARADPDRGRSGAGPAGRRHRGRRRSGSTQGGSATRPPGTSYRRRPESAAEQRPHVVGGDGRRHRAVPVDRPGRRRGLAGLRAPSPSPRWCRWRPGGRPSPAGAGRSGAPGRPPAPRPPGSTQGRGRRRSWPR